MNTNDKLQLHRHCINKLQYIAAAKERITAYQNEAVDIQKYSKSLKDKNTLIIDLQERITALRELKADAEVEYADALIQIIREPVNKTLCN